MDVRIPLRKKEVQIEKSVVLERSVVLMPTEMLGKAGLSKVQGKGNAKGTIAPRGPSGGGKGKTYPASHPEPSKSSGSPPRVKGRKPVRPPYLETDIRVSGSESSAVDNYLRLQKVSTGKMSFLRVGKNVAAKFDNASNLVKLSIDGKKHSVRNCLVKLPTGVYKYSGMVSVASKVVGAGKAVT